MTLGMIENRRAAFTRGYAGLISFERQKCNLCHRSITTKSRKSNWEWNGREANSNTGAGVDYKLNIVFIISCDFSARATVINKRPLLSYSVLCDRCECRAR